MSLFPATRQHLSWWRACFLDWCRETWERLYRPGDRCAGCRELRPDVDAHAKGWDWCTGETGACVWVCPACARGDTDPVQW